MPLPLPEISRIAAAAAGQTNSDKYPAGEVCTAPDYKAMYIELFRASEQAVRLLREAQASAEQRYIDAAPPPLRLGETPEPPANGKQAQNAPTQGQEPGF